MDFDILQRFLDDNLLDIGEDETRYSYLTQTALDIVRTLTETQSLIIPYILIALDPNCPSDEPGLEEVEQQLKSHWKMLRQKYPDRPRQLLRAIMLQAIDSVCEEDTKTASIAWLAGSSYLSFSELQFPTLQIYNDALKRWLELTGNADRYSYEDISQSSRPSIVALSSEDTSSSIFDLNYLESKWASLFANTYKDAPIPAEMNPVPFAPQSITYQRSFFPNEWLREFPPRAAAFFMEYIQQIYSQHTELTGATEKWLLQKQAVSRGDSLRLRVIWWKQAMYSQSTQGSYRSLDMPNAVLAMALDLHEMIPSIYPISIDFVLQENLRALTNLGINLPKMTIPQFIDAVIESRAAQLSSDLEYIPPVNKGRGMLIQYVISQFQQRSQNDANLQRLVGINPTADFPLTDIAVWLFRDLQAARLAYGQSE